MTSYSTDGTVGEWAREKLKCLGLYLDAYTKILLNQSWCKGTIFIDAFAGAGRAQLRKTQKPEYPQTSLFSADLPVNEDPEEIEYVDGSPEVALSIRHPFEHYFFVELNPDNAKKLYDRIGSRLAFDHIHIIQMDADAAIKKILSDPEITTKKHRGIVFLDPFGMQVSWSTIESVSEKGIFEVIINLPVGTVIQRLLPNSANFTSEQRQKLYAYFGSPDWFDAIYEKSPTLFGDKIEKTKDAGERLAEWYAERLKKLFGHASPPKLIKTSRGTHLYYLIWAGPHKKGLEVASYILSQ